MPIRGIEIFYKGDVHNGGSGGYISIKIYPIDPTMYINASYQEIKKKVPFSFISSIIDSMQQELQAASIEEE